MARRRNVFASQDKRIQKVIMRTPPPPYVSERHGSEVELKKRLLNVKEFREYVGVGESKARQMLHDSRYGFGVKFGGRLFADKVKVDAWLDSYTG